MRFVNTVPALESAHQTNEAMPRTDEWMRCPGQRTEPGTDVAHLITLS